MGSGVTAALLGLVPGCVSNGPRPDAVRNVSTATGVQNAVVFERRGLPLDQPDVQADVLTLAEAVRQAMRADPDIQAALGRARAAEAEADQAGLLPNPILSVVFRFPENSGKPIIEAGLAADLVSVLQRPGRVGAADRRLRAASAEVVTVALDLLADVQKAYVEVQSLDALMPVLDERRKLIDRLVELAQARLDKGEGTRLDLTTLDTQRLELEVEIAEKRLDRRRARLGLARLVGQPSSAADWRVTPWVEPPQVAASESAWVASALTHRPEVEAGRWELAALGVDLRLTRFAPFEGADVGVGSERDEVWTVGPAVTVPLPLFDWGQSRRAKAEALVAEASHKLTKVRRQVVEQVRTEYATFASTRAAAVLARDRLVPAQERRRRETEAAYRAGTTDVTTLILADQDLQAARAKLIDLQQKTSSALFRLQRAVGGPGVTASPAPTTLPATSATRPSSGDGQR